MRENESDSGDGWRGPHDYVSPWAARDPGGTDQAPADGPDLPPESGRPDTIAFGRLADEAGGPGQGSYVQRGYGDPPPQTLIVVGRNLDQIQGSFVSCTLAAHTWNRFGVLNEETREHPDIFVCRTLRQPWPEFWKTARHFG